MADVRDVVVVGAGVIGCAVAYELSRRGADVQVIDARGVGQGATQASAGMLTPYSEADPASPLSALGARSLDLYDRFIEDVRADSGLDVAYVRNGSLHVASGDAEVAHLAATAQSLARSNVAYRLLDADQVRVEEPLLSSDVQAGLLIPAHGQLAARDLSRALGEAARRHGAKCSEPAPVLRLTVDGPDMRVETSEATVAARHVVLSAGSWSGAVAIEGLLPVPVRPVRGQLLQVAWHGEPLRRIVWGQRCYAVPFPDQSVLVGATVEEAGFDERVTVEGMRDLLDAVADLVPCARRAGFVEARVGLRPGSPDDMPIVGSPEGVPGLVYATGHYRNGVLLAPLTAVVVADLVLEGRHDAALEVLSPRRFSEAGADLARH